MFEINTINLLSFELNGILALISSLVCSAVLFLKCAKKSQPSTTSIPGRAGGVCQFEPPISPRRSSIHKDILSNPKKTDLIRLGKLKVDKKNPDYDTLMDIDREVSLDKMDVSQKTLPKSQEANVYETLMPEPPKSVPAKKEISVPQIKQTPSKPSIPLLRRESIPLTPESNLPNNMHTASKAKVVLVDPTQRISTIPLGPVDNLEATGPPQKKLNPNEAADLEQRRRSSTLFKVPSKSLAAGNGPKQSAPSPGSNMWDAVKSADKMKKKGTKIVYSQYVKG